MNSNEERHEHLEQLIREAASRLAAYLTTADLDSGQLGKVSIMVIENAIRIGIGFEKLEHDVVSEKQ